MEMDTELVGFYIERLKQNLNNITQQYVIMEARHEMINKKLEEAYAALAKLEASKVDTKASKSK